jgi:predicted transcriptional regulator
MTDSDNPGADARRKYEDSEFKQAVSEHQPASTKEVADTVGCLRRTADYRLKQLRDEGAVESKMAGNSLIWFLAD